MCGLGKSLIELKKAFEARPSAFDSFERRLLVLSRPRAELEQRIRLRVNAMLAEGLVQEVRQLLDRGIEENPSAARAIGYRETIECLRGKLPAGELAETISLNTRKLLKKQRTWFKKFLPEEAIQDISKANELPGNWLRVPANPL